jgi:hypothetical protein
MIEQHHLVEIEPLVDPRMFSTKPKQIDRKGTLSMVDPQVASPTINESK